MKRHLQRGRRFVPLGFAILLLTRGVAAAPPIDEAQTEMERGVQLAERGDYEGALKHYRRAQEIIPQANVPWRFAGDALVKLERWQEAVDAYARYVAIRPDARDAEDVRRRIATIEQQHLGARVAITTAPAGAGIVVDGDLLAETTPRTIVVTPGQHVIRLHRAGYDTLEVVISVERGRLITIDRSLATRAASPASPAPSPATQRRSILPTIALASGVTTLAAAFAADVVLLGDARRDFDRAREAGDPSAYSESKRLDVTRAAVLGGYALGGALSLAGLVLFALPVKKNVEVHALPAGGGIRVRF